MDGRLQQSARLEFVSQRVGFALWQLQELESVAAQVYVLLVKAEMGMGKVAGNALIDSAKKETLGRTFRDMKTAGVLRAETEAHFEEVLSERNWLVHRSRETSGQAIATDPDTERLVGRVDLISAKALNLMNELQEIAVDHVRNHGVTEDAIQEAGDGLRRARKYEE